MKTLLRWGRNTPRACSLLLWSAAGLLTGTVLIWYALDAGTKEPAFAPLERTDREGAPALLDLNEATEEELDALPGIGPALAERIVAFREENGPFQAPEDVTEVPGIGPAVYEDIAPYIGAEQEVGEP